MILYRYLSAEFALRALQQHRFKVGRISRLNDPIDCAPKLVGPGNQAVQGIEAFEAKYLGYVDNSYGVLCFSDTKSDPVLWSHYADQHRGIAIGIKVDGPDVKKYTRVQYPDKNVRPTLELMKYEAAKHNGDEPTARRLFEEAFAVKAHSWKYEKEWRRFVNLNGHDTRMDGEHYFVPVEDGALVDIALGCRCSLSTHDVGRALRSWGEITVRVTQAKPSDASFELEFGEGPLPVWWMPDPEEFSIHSSQTTLFRRRE